MPVSMNHGSVQELINLFWKNGRLIDFSSRLRYAETSPCMTLQLENHKLLNKALLGH